MADTARWHLPLLEAGQAQKEMTVNEALARLDLIAQAGVVAIGVTAPPAAPAEGQAWIVGTAPTGAWAGQAQAIAGWTGGGWRFVAPREGMSAWCAADAAIATYAGGQWRLGRLLGAPAAAIAAPGGGGTIDAEARATIAAMLAALRDHRLIAN